MIIRRLDFKESSLFFLYMVREESPWLQPRWVFRAPPLRGSDATPQRPAFSKNAPTFV